MVTLLLAIIYLAFISLGLPDSLLGSSWPQMHMDFRAPVSFAGVITMIVSGGTIISSLCSDRLNRRFGTGMVTAASTLLTALALFGFSQASSIVMICLLAVPYGLGAGAIDAAINNYVALHYNSRQMSWLHCFWGLGASISPYIMGYALSSGMGWRSGYGMVSGIQIALAVFLFLSLPLWKKVHTNSAATEVSANPLKLSEAVKIKGVVLVLISFFGYCSLEGTCGIWASTYLVEHRGVDVQTAAGFASLFYLGITAGRFFSGFIADRLGDRNMIRLGLSTVIVGVVLILLPLETTAVALIGLVITGLGAAPVYPAIIHATPENFGKENSQAIIGIQMACAYVGSTFMPPLFGVLAEVFSMGIYPLYLAFFVVLTFVMTEWLNRSMKNG